MGQFFLEKLVYVYGCTLKLSAARPYPQPNLSTPGPAWDRSPAKKEEKAQKGGKILISYTSVQGWKTK